MASSSSSSPMTTCKVILLGDSGVGKANLIKVLTNEKFIEGYTAPHERMFRFKEVNVPKTPTERKHHLITYKDICPVRVNLDAYRSDDSRSSTRTDSFYRGVDIAMVVYDMTDRESFDHVEGYIKEIQRHAQESTQIVLVGTKTDLSEQRVVTEKEAEQLAKKHGILLSMETAAKTGTNVEVLLISSVQQWLLKISPASAQAAESKIKSMSERDVLNSAWLADIKTRNEIVTQWLAQGNNLRNDEWGLIRTESIKTFLDEIRKMSSAGDKLTRLKEALNWPLFNKGRDLIHIGKTTAIKAIKTEIEKVTPEAKVEEARAGVSSAGESKEPHRRSRPGAT